MNIVSIVVLYNPTGDLSNILSIANQSSLCILVDNSNSPISCPKILSISNVLYFWLGENKGIAEAQNVGINEALKNGADYVVFFDQDSEVLANMIASLHDSYAYLENIGFRVGLIGPRTFNKENGQFYMRRDRIARDNFRTVERRYTNVDYTLSSGSFCPVKVFTDVGIMDSSLFIDSVDHEYCWRLCSHGYQVFIDEDVLMPHMLGARQLSFFGMKVNIPSPIRHYYVFRNWCLLFRMPYVPITFKIRTALLMLPKATFFSLCVPPRFTRLRYIVRGLIDGILGKSGKFQ